MSHLAAVKHRDAVVKPVFVELREQVSYLKRLAFLTLTEKEAVELDVGSLTYPLC